MTDVYQMQTVVFGVLVPGRNIPGFPSVPSSLGVGWDTDRRKRYEDIKKCCRTDGNSDDVVLE